nr:reverse transcriptase domain-containing protein [Tanacetum cinerariifolium]
MATDGNGDPPVPDLQTMEELCHPTLNGRGGPIAPIVIQAIKFRLKNDMIQQVQNSCQFHGLPGNDANKHLDKFLHVTQSIKVNGVTDDALRLYLFTHSLTHHATAWFDRLPRNSINTFEQMAKMFLGKYFPPSMVTKLRNEITNFRQRASHGQNPPPAYEAPAYQASSYQALVHQAPIPQPQVVTTTEFTNYMKANDAILKNMQTNMTSLTNSNLELKSMFGQFMKMNTASPSGSRTLPSNTITNPEEDLKGITTYSGNAYQGPTIPTNSSSLPKVVERETEVTKDTPVVAPVAESVSAPKPNPKSSLPYPLGRSRRKHNLMPLSVWNKLSLPELSPTCMTLEITDRLISRPVWVAKDVFVKVGTFHFPADFVVVGFDADPRVPLILGRSFLKTGRALIDVYEGELTLHVGKESVTFNLDQTARYSVNYDAMSVNRIYLIDVAYEEYSQEVLGFSVSGNPIPSTEPIVSNSSHTLTPFDESDFLLEETDAFLAINDEPISSEIDGSYYDLEGYILLLDDFLNDDPTSPPLPPQELKVVEPTNEKSSIDESLMVELKDLPPHLEYAFLEAVQLQRRVNPKIHEVIKKEVLKLLDVKLIYPISDSPWVSPVHCVPKKGGFTVVENEENELIPTQLVTDPKDQEKTTFTCPYGTFAYRCMPFGLCNAPGTFQRCMMAMFHDMIKKTMEVFMEDFSVFGNSFGTCLSHFDKMLKRCEATNICLNWEKSHFIVKEGIILGHKISKNGIEVDKAKVDVIAKLPHPTTVKGIRSFLGHADFYQ